MFSMCRAKLKGKTALYHWNQSVFVNNSASSPSPLMFAAPQGTVLSLVPFVSCTTPPSNIIIMMIMACHSVNHLLFADDTPLQELTPPNGVSSLTCDLQSCTDDIKSWMRNNQLKINEDKPEVILFWNALCLLFTYHHQSLLVLTKLHFLTKLGTWGQPPVKQHVIKVCNCNYKKSKRSDDSRKCKVTKIVLVMSHKTKIVLVMSHNDTPLTKRTLCLISSKCVATMHP